MKERVAVAQIKRFLNGLGSQQGIAALHVGREEEWWVREVWLLAGAVGKVASRLCIAL
jgi:hypothetical protein